MTQLIAEVLGLARRVWDWLTSPEQRARRDKKRVDGAVQSGDENAVNDIYREKRDT